MINKMKEKILNKKRIEKNRDLFLISAIFLFLIIIFSLNFISAEVGCCFDASSGICSYNADSSACSSNGGEFYSTPSCSIAKCDKGCCVLGDKVRYGTSRTCELNSRAYGFGFPESFQMIPEADCLKLANAQSKGACLYGGDYEKNCKYSTFGECSSADFYAGVFCTEPSLNTTCKNTSKTMCYEGSVYRKDSCGNPAGKKQECNFQAGSVCKVKNANEAYCKSLDCYDPAGKKQRKNGERWCVLAAAVTVEELSKITGNAISTSPTGKVITGNDISGGFKSPEECAAQSAASSNANDQCQMLRKKSPKAAASTAYDPYSCKPCDTSLDACGENLCSRCLADILKGGAGESWEGRLEGCVKGESCKGEIDASVGSRYYTKYCLNGDIVAEPCADFRMEYCQGESVDSGLISGTSTEKKVEGIGDTGGECAINDWQACLGAVGVSGSGSSTQKAESKKEGCDEGFCKFISPVEEQEIDSTIPVKRQGNTLSEFEDELATCVPKLPGGFQFYPSSSKSSSGTVTSGSSSSSGGSSYCSLGNFEASLMIDWCNDYCNPAKFQVVTESSEDYSGAGLIYSDVYTGWTRDDKRLSPAGCNPLIYPEIITPSKVNDIPVNQELLQFLMQRCNSLGDCDGKANWVGAKGTAENIFNSNLDCKKLGSEHWECTFSFTCVPWKAPSSGDCSLCGKGNLSCSEYRCRALGKNCEYKEPGGADKGYCVSTSDHTPPVIKLKSQNPKNPVPPYTPVEFVIATDEESECKFNFNSAGGKYSEMKYSFGSEWGTEHKIILNLPGQRKNDLGVLEYPLIKEGKNTLYVRCVDAKGNGEIMSPYPINFEVMKTPDTIAPIIGKFNPISGSPIKYNTTSKTINFGINEPAECKWDFVDNSFENLSNKFNCDLDVTNQTLIKGYSCSGILTNITINMSSETKFYIRCKDQPWLAGKEDALYRRNTHQKSQEYILRSSLPLEITNVAPQGAIKKNPVNTSFEMRAFTSQGGFNGISNCSWRLSNSINIQGSFRIFKDTNKNIHTQLITGNLSDGTYYAEVMCFDSAGNEANKTFSFDFRLDREAPFIVRLLHNNGLLLKTDEDAICYFSNNKANGCFYDITNGTLMSGIQVEHKADWQYDQYYYVKCKDYYDNRHSGCGVVVRTY